MDVRAVIRELSLERDIRKSAGLVRNSFKTVAKEFHLDRGNCPAHPSFMRFHALAELKERGGRLFGLFVGEVQAGFVAVRGEVRTGFITWKSFRSFPGTGMRASVGRSSTSPSRS